MTFESHLPRGAKDTAHRAACLRGDTKCATVLRAAQILTARSGSGDLRVICRVTITHEHGFDQILIRQFKESLARETIRRIPIDLYLEWRESNTLCKFLA